MLEKPPYDAYNGCTVKMKAHQDPTTKDYQRRYLDYAGDRATENLQTMLLQIEDDFLPFLMNTRRERNRRAANNFSKLLKAE